MILTFIQCEIKHVLGIFPEHIMNRKTQLWYVLCVIACFTWKSALAVNFCGFEKWREKWFCSFLCILVENVAKNITVNSTLLKNLISIIIQDILYMLGNRCNGKI